VSWHGGIGHETKSLVQQAIRLFALLSDRILMEDYALTAMHTLNTLDNSTPASPPRREGRSVSRLSGSSTSFGQAAAQVRQLV